MAFVSANQKIEYDRDGNVVKRENMTNSKRFTAFDIKPYLMHYFRFKRGYFVCSEYAWNSDIDDIVAFSLDEIIAIEVKISKSDFLADFKKHKWQDEWYFKQPYFNRFYFAMPLHLKDFVLEYLSKPYNNNLHFCGVIAISNLKITDDKRYTGIEICKKAKEISPKCDIFKHRNPAEYKTIKSTDGFALMRRMSSELANLSMKYREQ